MSRKDIKKDILDGAIESAELTDEINAKINSLIDKSIRNIERAIEEVYTKYRDRYGLTDEEAIRYLKAKLTPTEVKKYADMGLLSQANAVSAGNQITRLIMLKGYIKDTFKVLETESIFHMEKLLIDVGTIASSRVYYSVGKEIGYLINWDMPKRNMKKLMKTDWLGGTYKTRLKETYGKAYIKIDEAVKDGLLRGKGSDYIVNQLSEMKNVTRSAKTRIVRTESSRFYEECQQQDYKDLGLEKWMWMSALDNRVCTCGKKGEKSCGELDGEVFTVGDKDAPSIPKHPNCRCCSVAYFDEETKNRLQRRYKVYNQQDRDLQKKIDKMKRDIAKKKKNGEEPTKKEIDEATRKYKIGHYEVSDKYLTYKEYMKLMQQ